MTERLFWKDAYAREFTARVVRRDGPRVVLDRTLFYPTGGGQPNDTGTLNGVRVTDVVEEGETIVHVLDGAPFDSASGVAQGKLDTGDEVKGAIDWDRRLDPSLGTKAKCAGDVQNRRYGDPSKRLPRKPDHPIAVSANPPYIPQEGAA